MTNMTTRWDAPDDGGRSQRIAWVRDKLQRLERSLVDLLLIALAAVMLVLSPLAAIGGLTVGWYARRLLHLVSGVALVAAASAAASLTVLSERSGSTHAYISVFVALFTALGMMHRFDRIPKQAG